MRSLSCVGNLKAGRRYASPAEENKSVGGSPLLVERSHRLREDNETSPTHLFMPLDSAKQRHHTASHHDAASK